MPLIPQKRTTRSIAVLVFDDFQLLDATGPIAAFEMPNRGAQVPPYEIHIISREGGAVRSSSGAALLSERWSSASFDTLLVAGGQGTYGAATCPKTLAFVRAAAERSRRVVSVCSGSYVLAAAGLLEGRRATTHWERAQDFQRRFPNIRVEADRIFIRDGALWTSAGVTAGIDLSLALIAEDLGEPVAKAAAQQLVVFYRRPGGQSQFSALLDLHPKTDRLARSLAFARQNLRSALGVEDLARAANLSTRQFSRAFLKETGHTPAKAIERLRIEAARSDIESSALSMERVAQRAGFSDPERMRRAFLRAFGTPPQALRRAANEARGGKGTM
jgi:transcriptional regulator GlxA family with amidase domain